MKKKIENILFYSIVIFFIIGWGNLIYQKQIKAETIESEKTYYVYIKDHINVVRAISCKKFEFTNHNLWVKIITEDSKEIYIPMSNIRAITEDKEFPKD